MRPSRNQANSGFLSTTPVNPSMTPYGVYMYANNPMLPYSNPYGVIQVRKTVYVRLRVGRRGGKTNIVLVVRVLKKLFACCVGIHLEF